MAKKKTTEKKRVALTADQIDKADDIKREWVPTPEWAPADVNGDECGVYVRALLASEKNAFELQCIEARDKKNSDHIRGFKTRVCSRVLVNDLGERLFPDVSVLDGKRAVVIDRLFDVAARLGGLSEDAKETAGNSDATADAEPS